MTYGIPLIPVPHVLDQLGLAIQLEKISVAIKHINAKDLSEHAIISAIEEMNRTYEEKKQNTELISRKINEENGLRVAVSLIGSVMESAFIV